MIPYVSKLRINQVWKGITKVMMLLCVLGLSYLWMMLKVTSIA